jgi:hypothetical protein
MFNRKRAQILLMSIVASVLVLEFQNCAKAKTSEYASLQGDDFNSTLGDKDPDPVVDEKVSTTFEPILTDRRYLKSVFTDVFGPRALAIDSTRTTTNALVHGDPCSVYEDQLTKDAKGVYVRADAMETCSRVSILLTVAPINPKSSVTRQALLTHACSDLTNNNITFDFALKKISADGLPAPTDANINKAFRLFYRFRSDPSQKLVESLKVMIPPTGATKDNWRILLNTVCASGYWQVL